MVYGIVAAAAFVAYVVILVRSVPPAPRLGTVPPEEWETEPPRKAG